MNRNLIVHKTLDVFIRCNIKTFPIDCFAVLEYYGYKSYTYEQAKQANERLFALCKQYSNDAFRYRNTICYNQNIVASRIRFSLMHELGHIVLGHEGESQESEDEADCFASNILAPRAAIFRSRCQTADDIHSTFGLSFAASNRALVDYKRWRTRIVSDMDKQIGNWFFNRTETPTEQEPRNYRLTETEKRIDFILKEDPDYFFRSAENFKLYGNDL